MSFCHFDPSLDQDCDYFLRLWNVSHPIGCPGYVKPSSSAASTTPTTTPTSCRELSLLSIECNLPLCPVANDTTASGLKTADSKSKLLTSNFTTKVGSQITYKCETPCECYFFNSVSFFHFIIY